MVVPTYRSIVVFGFTGVGKSWLIISLIGHDRLLVSDGAVGTTFATTPIEPIDYSRADVTHRFVDTWGLNEAEVGSRYRP